METWVGVDDCVKDKIIENYAIQMMGVDIAKIKPNQPKINHYKFMKWKVKSSKTKDKGGKFQDFLAKRDKQEENEEKLATPISVPQH